MLHINFSFFIFLHNIFRNIFSSDKYTASYTEKRVQIFAEWEATINDLKLTKLRGFSPQANYTDRATAACRRS
jgi:hypothetical protein